MKRLRSSVISILAIGLLAGSAVDVAAQSDEAPAPSAGCDAQLAAPGIYDGVSDLEGISQAYKVVVPGRYEVTAPAPLILWFASGLAGSITENLHWWEPYLQPAESVFVIVEPLPFTPALTAIVDQLSAAYCIDERRVHLMGTSSSNFTVATLACEASGRIGSFFLGLIESDIAPPCTPERPIPLMAMTGDTDRDHTTQSVEQWAAAYGCDGEPLVDELGSGVTKKTYQDCLADTVLYDVAGVGHGFVRDECIADRHDFCFQNGAFDLLREAERFFAEHPLPQG